MPMLKRRRIQPLNTSNEETDDKETVITSTSDDDADDESGDTAEDLSDEEAEDSNTDSDEEEEENEDEEEEGDEDDKDEDDKDEDDKDEDDKDEDDEDEDDEDEDSKDEDSKDEDSKDEGSKDEDSEDEEKKKYVPRRKIRLSDFIENKKGKIVTMDYCTKHLYKGPIQNIKDMLNGSAEEEIEIKEEAPDKNEPAFRNAPKKWGWKQEVMLLEGIEANGLFNWELIAEQLSKQSRKKFKPDEVKNHYFQYYYNGTLGQVWDYQLEEKTLEHFDHTDPIVVNVKKYLPQVAVQHLREIKFLPHREDFENYVYEDIERMLTHVDFSSYYINNLKSLKIDQEVRNLQLVIVDAYRTIVTERMKMYKLMQDFKLIEQFFLNMQNKNFKKCEVDRHFTAMQKFISFFDSPNEFIKFYVDCVREKLLKLEIARLYQVLATKRNKERDPEVKTLLKKRAPSFLDVVLLLDADKDFILHKAKKRKKKFKFTKRKRTR